MHPANNVPLPVAPTVFASGILCLTAVFNISAAAQTAPAPAVNLSGMWELRFDSMNVPPAVLVPAVAAESPNLQFDHDRNEIRWCHFFGVPYVMQQSPLDIVQNANGKEVTIMSPVRSPARHIYTDGRGHVNPDTYDPVSNGHSIGHWEGATLIVDTIGFSDEGVTRIPGGGRRTPDSHLIERFRMLDSNHLSVVSTWEDAKIFVKLHSYEVRYFRAPKFTELREFDCNASDEARGKFLLEPPGSQLK
jgi:hypothetical protein